MPPQVYDAVDEKYERIIAPIDRMSEQPPKCVTRKHEEPLARLAVEADILND